MGKRIKKSAYKGIICVIKGILLLTLKILVTAAVLPPCFYAGLFIYYAHKELTQGLNEDEQIYFKEVEVNAEYYMRFFEKVKTVYEKLIDIIERIPDYLVGGAVVTFALFGVGAYFLFNPETFAVIKDFVLSWIVGSKNVIEFIPLCKKSFIIVLESLKEFFFWSIEKFRNIVFNSSVPDLQLPDLQLPDPQVTPAEAERYAAAYKECMAQEVKYHSNLEGIKEAIQYCSVDVFSRK
jgi:hypothetical protein